MRAHRFSDVLVVAVFALGIGLPLFQQLTDLLPRVPVVDNRRLAPFPPIQPSAANIRRFAKRFDHWFADHMGLRGALVTAYRFLTDAVLRSPDKAIVGTDDWLYLLKGVREDIQTVPLFRDWCGRFPFTSRQLDSWVAAITANRDWLAARGIGYLFVVPPNKMTILPAHLPARFKCQRGVTRLEQLSRALAEGSGIHVITPGAVLRRAAQRGEPIWYRTDTHWNARGVALAYPVVMKRIRDLLPDAKPIDDFEIHIKGRDVGDLGGMVQSLGIGPDVIWDVRPRVVRSHRGPEPFPGQVDAYGRATSSRLVDDPDLPQALVFHDSFFDGAMDKFLSESFRRTVFVHYGRPRIDRALVRQAKPDIVIQEMVERNLLHPFF